MAEMKKQISIEDFFNKLNTAATWSAGVAFERAMPLPIDKYSVFNSLAAAKAYVTDNPVAYPGQVIAVISTDPSENNSLYYLKYNTAGTNLELAEVPNQEDAQAIHFIDDLEFKINEQTTSIPKTTQFINGTSPKINDIIMAANNGRLQVTEIKPEQYAGTYIGGRNLTITTSTVSEPGEPEIVDLIIS